MATTDSDSQADGIHFACTFESGAMSGAYWITLVSSAGEPLPIPRVTVWRLTSGFAAATRDVDSREVIRRIRSSLNQPYPLLARFQDDICVYENPQARSLAQLVREVRPAHNDLEAAERITAPGPPVRDLAYVIAPNGRSKSWKLSGPLPMTPGKAQIHSENPDDLRITTSSVGEGFLVLAITRCIGWSANIDGQEVPIHAVDGPFMGLRVPPGDHEVRVTFRPVLMWAGTLAAVLTFGGAWTALIVGAIFRRRRHTSHASDTYRFGRPARAA
jgi:Bacterial membrane protein YfhO